ncbi:MAG: hypothetical protein EoVTN8_750 [Fluviibacter phosphoraccumulans EoVTN8]
MYATSTNLTRNFLLSIATLCLVTGITPVSAQEKPEIKYAEVNGIKLAYYTRGQGAPLLMINGFMSTLSL